MDIKAAPPKRMRIEPPSTEEQIKCFHGFARGVTLRSHMFKFVKKIGTGASAEVFKAKCATDRKCEVAIKIIPKIGWKAGDAANEKDAIQTLIKQPHPNIIEYFGYFEEDEKLFIVMELGKENFQQVLRNNISELSIQQFQEVVFQVLETLNHLDSINIYHNDFKLENMVFLNGKLKLIDFGKILKKESRGYDHPASRLINAACFLTEIQLQMKYGLNYKEFGKLIQKFREAALSESFNETDAEKLSDEPDIWHDQLPPDTIKLLSRCFIYQESIQKQIIKERDSITPRSELLF